MNLHGPADPAVEEPVPDASELLARATAHHRAGRVETAVEMYRQIVDRDRRHASALFYLGQALGQINRRAEGIEYLRRAIAVRGDKGLYHANLAALLLKEGEAKEAVRHARRAIQLDPDDVVAHSTLAGCHERMNRTDEAIESIERALEIAPDDPDSVLTLASLRQKRKQYAEARAILEAFLEHDHPPEYQYQAWKELAVVLDRLGEYEDAFHALVEGGREQARTRAARSVDPEGALRRVADYREHLSPDLFTRWTAADLSDSSPRPAFLVGFPRSGTTMTEQVMAAHPDIITADERPLIRQLKDAMAAMFDDDLSLSAMLRRLNADQVRELRRVYWDAAASDVGSGVRRSVFVDKLPLHLVDIGLLNVVFPDARVIVALRDPRDVCLSCFTQRFGMNSAMINFLRWERTAEFYARVMDLWLHVRPWITMQYIEIRYEDTVVDLAAQAKRILGLLDVPWNDEVLQFHRRAKEKFISTPSYVAVTEPVHTRAVARWRHYERQIEQVMPHLAPFIEAFGYAATE